MSRPTALLRAGLAGVLALSLAGCISLLPKSEPAQLYRFGADHAATPEPTPAANPVGVFWSGGSFPRESAGDRILTINGPRAAYIAGVRWVAPADLLFQQAVQRAFEAKGGPVRIIQRGMPGVGQYVLRLDVRNFETRYDAGPDAAPTILVRVQASLARDGNRQLVSEEVFEASARASDNRVGAIVAAYDAALGQVLDKVVAWATATAV
jgi:cholesterol transport system auxiliary component